MAGHVHGSTAVPTDHPYRCRRDPAGPGGPEAPPGDEMSDLLQLVAFVAGWYLLQRLVLPRLGVPT